MTYEKPLNAQAELRTVRGSTIERKIMSTKTSFKRVALVAVAALGMGVLTSVSPASAANVAGTQTSVAAATGVTTLGTASTTVVSVAHGGLTASTSDTLKVKVSISVPSGSAVTAADSNGDGTATDSVINSTADDTNFSSTAGALASGVFTSAATSTNIAAGTTAVGTATVTPDVAGAYVITVQALAADGTTAAGTATTYTVTAGDLWGEVSDGVSNGTQTNTAISAVAGAYNNVTLSFRSAASTSRLIAVTGGSLVAFTAGTNATGTISTDKTSMVVVDDATAETSTFTVATPTVGTITVKAYKQSQGGIFSTTEYGTVTITVNAAAVTGTIDATASTATLSASGTGVLASDSLSLTAAQAAGATVGSIRVQLAAVVGSVLSTNATSISITGPGYLTVSNGTVNSTGISLTEIGSDADFNVAIIGNGTSGKATVTVKSGTWTASRTVTFYGSASKLVATQVLKRASSAGAALGDTASATTSAANVVVTDASGNPVAGVTPVAVSATTTVIASGTCSASDATGTSFCSVTSAAATAGKTSSVTFKTTVSGVDVVSNALTYTLGGALAKFTAAFDKTSYAPGAAMTLVISGVDADGVATFDGSKDILDGSHGSSPFAVITSSSVTNDWTAAAAGIVFVDGKGSLTIYAPLSAGPFTVTLNTASGLETAMGATTLTASTTVSESTAVTSLTTLINSLIKKLNALATLVAKIQKKLGVK
jgi:hypothetical protein